MKKALKQWGTICEALASGRQTVILLQDDTSGAQDGFRLPDSAFLLFPILRGQSTEEVLPEARALGESADSETMGTEEIIISHYVVATDTMRLKSPAPLLNLPKEHVWTEAALNKRFDEHPDDLVYLTIARVFALSTPAVLSVGEDYGGAEAWVDLAENVPITGSRPILGDSEFIRRSEAIRAALGAF